MKDLWGRTALVTGASRGLGVYIARALADEGMNLVLAARTAEGLEAARAEAESKNRKALALVTDVSDPAQLRGLAEKADSAFGGVDVLVNNAGIDMLYRFEGLAEDDVDAGIDVNLRAPMQLARLLLPGMLERRRGHIVNISSLAGKYGPAFNEVYAATKAGLVGFTQSLRMSYQGTGVSASVICPGFVSEVGMYARGVEESGVEAPKTLGVSQPEAVSSAVVRAIRRDAPEVIVNPLPIRPLLAFGQLAPGLGEKLALRMGAGRVFEDAVEWQEAHERRLM